MKVIQNHVKTCMQCRKNGYINEKKSKPLSAASVIIPSAI